MSYTDKLFFVARGSWLVARGSWLVVRGSWFVVRGSWLVVRRGRPNGRPAVIFDHSPFWYYGEPFFGLRCSFAATDS